MRFVLLGHDSASGEYPSPVVPIGLVDGSLSAAFRNSEGVEFVAVGPDSQFMRHDTELTAQLAAFDPSVDSLFAFHPTNVVAYPVTGEPEFFDSLLRGENRNDIDPFLRLSLAFASRYDDLILKEIIACTRIIWKETPEYLAEWHRQNLDDLASLGHSKEAWPAVADEFLVIDDEAVPQTARSAFRPVNATRKRFQDSVGALRSVVARSGGNGAVSKLDSLIEDAASLRTRILITGSQREIAWTFAQSLLVANLAKETPLLRFLDSATEEYVDFTYSAQQSVKLITTAPSALALSAEEYSFLVYAGCPPDIARIEIGVPSDLCREGMSFYCVSAQALQETIGKILLLDADVIVYVLAGPPSSTEVNAFSRIRARGLTPLVLVCDQDVYEAESLVSVATQLNLGNEAVIPIDLPALNAKRSLSRYVAVVTGIARLEAAIAKISVLGAIVPRLTRLANASIEIGDAHSLMLRTQLNAAENTSLEKAASHAHEIRAELSERRHFVTRLLRDRLETLLRRELPDLKERFRSIIAGEVQGWTPRSFRASALERELVELMRKCSDKLTREAERFRLTVLRALQDVSEVAERWEGNLKWSPTVVDPTLSRVASDAPAWRGALGAAFGYVGFAPLIGALVGFFGLPGLTTARAGAIRGVLLNGRDDYPGMLAGVERWTELIESNVVKAFSQAEDELQRNALTELASLDRSIEDLLRATELARQKRSLLMKAIEETQVFVGQIQNVVEQLNALRAS